MAWIEPILKLEKKARGRVRGSYNTIVKKLGEPNVTQLDDPLHVNASWAFKDDQDREAFVWGLYTLPENEMYFQAGGDPFLLQKVFGHSFEGSVSGWV